MAQPQHFTLDKMIRSTDYDGAMRLYIYEATGYHSGGQWFRQFVRYPDEEIPSKVAKRKAEAAIEEGLEVRITNGDDHLVLHAIDGEIVFPPDPDAFWRAVGAP
jgi:hypothetical protein